MSQLNTQRQAAAESRAILNLKSIHNAQTFHFSQKGRFGESLKDISEEIPPPLASGAQGGYKYTLTGSDMGKKFTAIAVPESFGGSGTRTFLIDETV